MSTRLLVQISRTFGVSLKRARVIWKKIMIEEMRLASMKD